MEIYLQNKEKLFFILSNSQTDLSRIYLQILDQHTSG